MTEEKTKKASVTGIIFSFLIPFIGLIKYFQDRNNVENPSAYLWAALGGFILAAIVNLIMPA